LLLETDSRPTDGGLVIPDGSTPDGDRPRIDGQVSDGSSPSDGTVIVVDADVVDAVRPDGGPPALPVVLSGRFEHGSVGALPAGEYTSQELSIPFAIDRMKFVVSTPLDVGMVTVELAGRLGTVAVTTDARVVGAQTWIEVTPTDDMGDGWFCLHIASSPDLVGQYLDGEWDGGFPSGDGVPGGDFVYTFRSLVGDANGDGSVDAADYATIRDAFKTSDPRADLDGSGTVDTGDTDVWNARYGYTDTGGARPERCPLPSDP
jgi:hypothetical protein